MSRHRASSMINIYGTNYCADHTNGNIYEYSLDILSDNGDSIVKERDTAVIHGGLFGEPDAKLFYDEVEFIIVSGYKDQSGTGMGPQRAYAGCLPGFVFYKRRLGNHQVTNDSEQEDDGKIVAYNGSQWVLETDASFNDAPTGGWFHLSDIYDNLADQSLHNKCDILTWYGNPGSMCEDRIWSQGGGGDNINSLTPWFWRNNVLVSAPGGVLGACIQTVEGLDYYYVLTNNSDSSNPLPKVGGADDKVYRKLVSAANHPSTGWTLILTVPYTDYATVSTATFHPPSFGTAYVDASGVAWYTKVFGKTPTYEYALMKVDMVNATHEIYDSNLTNPGSWSVTETGTSENQGLLGPNFGTYTLSHSESRAASASGEIYMFTMGGMEARYDLYASFSHADSYSFELNPSAMIDLGAGQYGYDAAPVKTWSQTSNISLIIKKNGVTLRTMSVMDYADTFASSATSTMVIDELDPQESYPVTVYSGGSLGPEIVTQRWYIFMNPIAPEEDIYLERTVERNVFYDEGLGTIGDKATLSIYRGFETPVLLKTAVREDTAAVGRNDWYDWSHQTDPNALPDAKFYTEPAHSFSDSGTCADWIKPNTSYYRPVFKLSMDEAINQGYTPFGDNDQVQSGPYLNAGIGWLTLIQGYTSASGNNLPYKGYQHGAERGVDFYLPEYAAISRPISAVADWSYVFVLQTIYDNPYADTMVGTGSGYNMIQPDSAIYAAVSHNDVNNLGGLWYVVSLSGEKWTAGQTYVADEIVFLGDYMYNCILANTAATLTNKPETGSSWATYWERISDHGTHVRSNVLTEAEIRTITSMTAENYMPEVGLVNVRR